MSQCIQTSRRFRRAVPDRDGWWLFRENGYGGGAQRILVIGGYAASEDEWKSETNYYWDGCSVTEMSDGTLTRGLWKFDDEVSDDRP